MTTMQAFLFGMMIAWPPSLVVLGWFLLWPSSLLKDSQNGVTD
jgi:hypothetical protein